jgi:catechol 2,3-dioxygenase-like lactoylglutathione lyase family enzyme
MTFTAGISEVVLVVPDPPSTARFYRDVVALQPDEIVSQAGAWFWFWTGQPGHSQRLLISAGPLYLEERSPLPEGQRWGRVHFALEVPRPRLDGAVEHIRGHGVEVHGPTHIRWMKATAYYFYDPDGNLLELWSPDPPGGPPG